MAKATKDALAELHGVIAEELTKRISSGLWAASDVAAAIKFLKDNDVTADPTENQALNGLKEELVRKAAEKKKQREAVSQTYTSTDELVELAKREMDAEFNPDKDWMN